MQRVLKYLLVMIVSIILQIILFSSPFIDSLTLLLFIISSYFLLFTREELPNNDTLLQSPEVRTYYKSKMNIYGYFSGGLFIILSLLFSIIMINIKIRLGILVIIIWILAVIGMYLITKYTQERVYKTLFFDWLTDFYKNDLTINEYESIYSTFSVKNQSKKEIIMNLNSKGFQGEFLIEQYRNFNDQLDRKKVISDEIKILNERQKN